MGGRVGFEPLFDHLILHQFQFCFTTSVSCSDCWSCCTGQTCLSRKLMIHTHIHSFTGDTVIRSCLGLLSCLRIHWHVGFKGIKPLTLKLMLDPLFHLSQEEACLIVRERGGVQRAMLYLNYKIQCGLLSQVVICLFTEALKAFCISFVAIEGCFLFKHFCKGTKANQLLYFCTDLGEVFLCCLWHQRGRMVLQQCHVSHHTFCTLEWTNVCQFSESPLQERCIVFLQAKWITYHVEPLCMWPEAFEICASCTAFHKATQGAAH